MLLEWEIKGCKRTSAFLLLRPPTPFIITHPVGFSLTQSRHRLEGAIVAGNKAAFAN